MPLVEERTRDRQVVVLSLAGEQYGVDIARVQEILRPLPITHVPYTPAFVDGVINLRGRVVPIIDPRVRFGLGKGDPGRDSRVVVADINGTTVGLLVDGVADILRISAAVQELPSPVVAGIDSAFIASIAKLDDRLVVLLDLNRLLSDEEQEALEGND